MSEVRKKTIKVTSAIASVLMIASIYLMDSTEHTVLFVLYSAVGLITAMWLLLVALANGVDVGKKSLPRAGTRKQTSYKNNN